MNKQLFIAVILTLFTGFAFAESSHEHDEDMSSHVEHQNEQPHDESREHDVEGDGAGSEGENHRDDAHGEDSHEEGHEEEGHIEVSAERAKKAGIRIAIAGSEQITDSVALFGRTEPDPQQVSHVRARFPGLIRSVNPALGEQVSAGQTIAVVEGNDSLQRYSIKAPISGTVVERHANAGEYAGENELLTIANYSRLWVALNVFPQDAGRIQPGQRALVKAGERRADSRIAFLNPGTGSRPSVMARLPLENADARWTPGLLVEAEVIVSREPVALAIDNRAIQRVENQTVVFRQEGDGFEVVPVSLLRSDSMHSEVAMAAEGLRVGDRYAVQNSYLLKAELEKSGASHAH